MKFNMGCGARKLPGFLNIDAIAASQPDEVFDLEQTPWPWPSDVADTIVFNHSLEHMGGDPKVFLAIMSETYRIASDGCEVRINVPHPRHDDFLGDPTHVRAVTPQTLQLFDRKACEHFAAAGAANTPFAIYLGVDFELVHTDMVVGEPYLSQLKRGEIDDAALADLARQRLNVIREYRFTLKVRKPPPA